MDPGLGAAATSGLLPAAWHTRRDRRERQPGCCRRRESADLDAYLESWTTINNKSGYAGSRNASARRRPRVPASAAPRNLLLAKGLITEAQLREGLAESYATRVLLGRVLLVFA